MLLYIDSNIREGKLSKGISGFFETVSKQENNQYTVTFVRVSYQREYLDSLKQYLNKKIINIQ
jgi:hypothetical protein